MNKFLLNFIFDRFFLLIFVFDKILFMIKLHERHLVDHTYGKLTSNDMLTLIKYVHVLWNNIPLLN